MATTISTLGTPVIGAISANNKYPSFIGADSKKGTTVIKHLHQKVYEEVHLMYVARLNHHTFSTDNFLSTRDLKVLDPFGEKGLDLSNRYEIRRKGNTFYIQKINTKGKVFQFQLHVLVEGGELKYKYVWKNKIYSFLNGRKVKMRMFASHQLGINLAKIYETKAA